MNWSNYKNVHCMYYILSSSIMCASIGVPGQQVHTKKANKLSYYFAMFSDELVML